MQEQQQVVGFIGLGNAGHPMARELVNAGHDVIVTDRDEARVSRFLADNAARAAGSAADFAAADVVFTMLPHGGVVREVLLGSGGVADHLKPGTVVVDTSSSDPIGTRALAAELAERRIALVDSAVSEPRIGDAKRGGATFMVGADDEATLERVRPLLEVLSVHLFHVGPTGSGHAMKTLNNFISASGLYAALDAVVAAESYGVNPARMLDVFNAGTARNLSTEGTLKYKALPRTFERSYSVGLLAKDMGIAASLAREVGFETELYRLMERKFAEARDDVGYEEDLTATLRHWEHVNGVELPPYPAEEAAPKALEGEVPTNIAFVGLGRAGASMAANLAAAVPGLLIRDIDLDKARSFAAEHGATVAERVEDLADVDVLVLMVPDGHVVRSILMGEERLADRLKPGTLILNTSSCDPEGTRALAAELAERGLPMVDAGMTVPDLEAVREGRVTFMAGADDERDLERARPVLGVMGGRVFHMGGVGTGHATKTLNNYVGAAAMVGTYDGVIVGHRYGLDPMTMMEVLNVSTGRNFNTEETLPLYALPRDFNAGFNLDLLTKDLRIALGFAKQVGVDPELFQLTHDLVKGALDDVGPVDVSTMLVHWEHKSGDEIPAAERAVA